MSESPFVVRGGAREPSAAERFVRRGGTVTTVGSATQPGSPEPEPDRFVSLRALLDSLSMALIVTGCSVGTGAAWLAGGDVPGLATLAGCLIGLGLLLTI
jgi:hypothetical protein